MKPPVVDVPVSLLLAPDLPASAKLVWMVAHQDAKVPTTLTVLEDRSGLSRPTVRKAYAHLTTAGWRPAATPGAHGVTVPVPLLLLQDRQISILAKVLYGVLQGLPNSAGPTGTFTYTTLCALTGSSLNPIKGAIRDLTEAGWLKTTQSHQLAPIQFVLADPLAARIETERFEARNRIEESPYRGEALMREYLSLLIDTKRYRDDAEPSFLINPLTGKQLQLDRYYDDAKVAFEYNGPQHYEQTGRFTAKQVAEQRVRDLIKYGLCWTESVHLVLIHAEDLTLETMKQKVGALLPLRDLRGYESLIDLLELSSQRHREELERLTRRDQRAARRRSDRPSGKN